MSTPTTGTTLVDLATAPADDLTRLRQCLAGGERESSEVVRRIVGLIQQDLSSGRRGFADTMTVLKQLRACTTVGRALTEQLKTLGVDVFMAPPGSAARAEAEQRVRDWLRQHA